MTQLSQIGAGRQVSFGVNPEKKETAKKIGITAGLGAAAGAAAGLGAGALKKTGALSMPVPTDEPMDLGKLKAYLDSKLTKEAEEAASEPFAGATKRTAKKVLSLIEKAANKTGEDLTKITNQIATTVKEGTRPLKKGAMIGAAVGAAAMFAYNKFAGNKEAAPAQEIAQEAQPQQ